MCGIAGIFRRRGVDAEDARRIAAMSRAVAHRGPDDSGYLQIDSASGKFTLGRELAPAMRSDVLFGSRRLAIIDPSPAGWQPMANAAGNLFLVFNGAIYNYCELKDELASRGRNFASGSDTEVILHAYEEWGADAVMRFNGMWAFALWDQRRRVLFCSRDRFGVKPFYYYIDDDLFVFGSEIKALLPALPRTPSPDWPMLHAFLTRNALCHTSATLLAGVQRLGAGQNLLVTNTTTEAARYWSYDLRSHAYDYARPEETFASLLDDAVRLRLRGDVPVGIALSGGLDSSAIAALAQRHSNGRLKVFTAVFPDTPQDERRHAEIVAQSLEAEHHLVAYNPATLLDDLRRLVWHMDHPAPHPQVLPRWALMNEVTRHVKVILEGQGSDEMLGGYPRRYFPFWLRDEASKLRSPALFGACSHLARALAARYRADPRSTIAMLARRLGARSRRSLTPTAVALSADFRAMARQIGGEPRRRAGGLDAALLRDHERDLLPWLLMLGDAISMGWSLESRLPFLDYRLVEFCFGLDRNWKFDGVETKIILRRMLDGLVPPAIAARPDKIGFDVPLGQWMAGSIEDHIRPVLLSARARSRGIFDMPAVESTLASAVRGARLPTAAIFRWLSIEMWFQLFVDDNGPRTLA